MLKIPVNNKKHLKLKIVSIHIDNELDVSLTHKRASQLGALTKLSFSQQTRFATAISEVCRNSLEFSEKTEVNFEIREIKNEAYLLCIIFGKGNYIENIENLRNQDTPFSPQNRESGIINASKLVQFVDLKSQKEKGIWVTLGFPVKTTKPITKDTIRNWLKNFTALPVSPYEELKFRNFELINQYEGLQDIISIISHDLRNPISSLMLSSDILYKNINSFEKEKIERFAEIINKSSHKINVQLDELLEWAKFHTRNKAFFPVKLQLLHVAEGSIRVIEDFAKQKKIKIIVNIRNDFYLLADPLMLRSILQNLITNAIKYTPNDGTVTISAFKINDVAEISVKDTGIGMTEDIKGSLFNKEFSSREGTNKEKGSGLGLKLVKNFVSKHHGEIHVESEPDKGTTIKVGFPFYEN